MELVTSVYWLYRWYLKLRKYYNFGTKDSRRAWQVVKYQSGRNIAIYNVVINIARGFRNEVYSQNSPFSSDSTLRYQIPRRIRYESWLTTRTGYHVSNKIVGDS